MRRPLPSNSEEAVDIIDDIIGHNQDTREDQIIYSCLSARGRREPSARLPDRFAVRWLSFFNLWLLLTRRRVFFFGLFWPDGSPTLPEVLQEYERCT